VVSSFAWACLLSLSLVIVHICCLLLKIGGGVVCALKDPARTLHKLSKYSTLLSSTSSPCFSYC
jgi:hypothetical protein